MLEKLFRRLPRPLLDRLIALRNAYPKTSLSDLPQPVRQEVKAILTSAGAPQGTSLHHASQSEREDYWQKRHDIPRQDRMKAWEEQMQAMLEPYKTDATQREHLVFLRRLLREHNEQPIETVEVSPNAIYRIFFQEANGDINDFARRIVSTNTRDEINRNQELIGQLAKIYGDQTATRALPLIAAITDAQEHRNGHTASPPVLSSVLGTDVHTGQEVAITQKSRQQGLYIIGVNGTGKTTLIANMILRDIRDGCGLALIEPHGDLTAQILAGIPRHRLNDVVYLDVEDWEYPFGLNIFEVPPPPTIRTMAATASFVSHVWEVLWHSGFDTPRLMQNLRAVTRTLLSNPGSTFGEIPLLYANEEVRARMLANVTNTQIIQFWEEYERKPSRDRSLFTESTLNKVTAFLDEPMIQHILAQTKTTINFRYIMDNAKILLIKLSPQFEEASRLIGAVIIGKLLMTAFSRADTAEDKSVQFNLYCDEFHRFASSDFATLISEARKFRISTNLSNQTLTQLSEANRASALAAGNLICFRVSGEDSRVLARSFDTTPTQQVIGEEPVRAPVADVISHLVRHGALNPTVAKFTAEYLMPLEALLQKVGTYSGLFEFGCCLFRTGYVIEAKRLLNDCLFQCMQTGRAAIFLPPLALFTLGGAADDGMTQVFYPDLRHRLTSGAEFIGFYQSATIYGKPDFLANKPEVAYLLKKYAKKRVWDDIFDSRIATPGPSFIKMLTLLRQAMEVLAREPILVDTGQYRPRLQNRTFADMEAEIARDLTNAPNFTARVKLLSGEYTIRTKPAPETLTGNALTERIEAIKKHMRTLGYTRHYQEVEEEIRQREARYLGITDNPPPTHTNGHRSTPATDDAHIPDEPPPGSFTLD